MNEEMRKRIRAQFLTLQERGVRHVVLSAFGCGAFGNDPEDVASMYKDTLEEFKDALDVVVFAIYYAGHGENNFEVFRKVLTAECKRKAPCEAPCNGKRRYDEVVV